MRKRNPCQGTIISSCIWSETVARQVKSLQARFSRISARKDSASTSMPVTIAEGVESGLAKNLFRQKIFDEIWERQKQNMWTEVLLKRLNLTASGSKI